MKITLKNEVGQVKQVKVGFSWTMFFFGFFVPLFRGDWMYMIITLLASVVTAGISWLVFPFIYNKLYINNLLKKGWKPTEAGSQAILKQKNFGDIELA
ncbi:DUF2628 domain-containing protein [Clostridium sp.]|jgi:hypothetical protein|uniref:DUF2628 domain-containing protein n=1 Tax=Clostridium sp. TaxID=1506 RepID=UPI0025FF10D8|nr:DUF2628 domain-containing protein [Clostridium sp.]MDY2631644.1 DUF2628 domain-containing protein [Clostridium sp.]